jgi:uncharacterized protein (TIGR03083 family)
VNNDDEVFALLASAAAVVPPDSLRAKVLDAAADVRRAGEAIESLGGGQSAHAADAYVRTVAEFSALLDAARGDEIIEPYGWTAVQLVGHLLDVDRYFGRQLRLWEHAIDESLEDDHLAMTQAAVQAAAGADYAELVTRWRAVADQLGAHIGSLDAEQLRDRIKFHLLDTRLSTVLVVRVFEVWTHIEDLSRALRRPPPGLDAARLHLMTATAVAAIPLGMLLAAIDAGQQTARLVLTGPGGGVWTQPLRLGSQATDPAVTIVADALEFCRLAAQRTRPDELDAEVEGSIDLAIDVLRGASVFAA